MLNKILSILLLGLLTISILSLVFVSSQELGESGLPENLEKFQEKGTEIQGKLISEEERTAYLKQEWGKILEKNKYIGPIMKVLNSIWEKISPVMNPIFKLILGREASLSWIFFLVISIWVFVLIYVFRILDLSSPLSDWVNKIISLAIAIIFGVTGITNKVAEGIIYLISLTKVWWVQLILIAVVIVGFFVASFLSKFLKEISKKRKKEKQEAEEKATLEKLKAATKVAETFTEGAGI